MTLLVDTSVWSLAFRRDAPPAVPEVDMLARALSGKEDVVSTGVIIVELLRGFLPTKVRDSLAERLTFVPLLEPSRDDYVAAAELINTCRRSGVQLGTIDGIIAQLAITYDVTLLTTDRDFTHAAECVPLRVWS